MTNNNAVGSRILQGVIFAALLAIFSLAACGSGGGDSDTTTNTNSAAAPSGIVLSLVPARSSGVAPLAVFFDASATTDIGVTTRPFHDLEYTWSFGDPSSGTWASGAQPGVSSKNSATGPVAAHVFETPGTYTVTLTAFDGTNTATTNTTITVQDPDAVFAGANTICINASGSDFTGCPSGADTSTNSNFVTALSANLATHKRILFKRGDTFTAASIATLAVDGPGIIGAFGTGAAPVVQMTGNTTIMDLSSAQTPHINDWRIIDLDFNGMNKTASKAFNGSGGIKQILFLRMKIRDTHGGFGFSSSTLDYANNNNNPGHTIFDEVSIIDSSVLHTIGGNGGNGAGMSASRLSMIGNLIDDSVAAEHVLRILYAYKGFISNNTLSNQAPLKAIIKTHGPTWVAGSPPTGVAGADSDGYTQQVVFSDNKIASGNGTDWTVNTGPQNESSDERLRDIIFERNWFMSGSTTTAAIVVNAVDVTLRNNIFDMTNGPGGRPIQVSKRGTNSVEPPPKDVHIYNNTFYTAAASTFTCVDIRASSSGTRLHNNLGSAPAATSSEMVSDNGTGTAQSNNLLNNTPSELFSNATPSTPSNFALKSLPNPARDTGLTIVPVFSDFFRNSRPQNGIIDLGAVEGP